MTDPSGPIPAPEPEARPGTIHGRLAQAVREQNWFTAALELGIVVLGVVVAFQITAWGTERAARAEEQELLRGLQAEFTQVVSDLQLQVEKHRRIESAVAATLEALTQAQRTGASSGTVADSTLGWGMSRRPPNSARAS